jgi:glutamyl-tRNA synthetase
MNPIKVRFAPSPTGRLHVGNLRTALVNYLLHASKTGGRLCCVLMIQMMSVQRQNLKPLSPGFEWMGMGWDCEDRQSSRLARYDQALAQLVASGARLCLL